MTSFLQDNQAWIILIESIALLIAVIFIIILMILLQREKQKRHVPLLTFILDQDSSELRITNAGDCIAKNIHIHDLNVELAYDFKKVLTLKFDDVAMLHPKENVVLKVRPYDGEHFVTSLDPRNLAAHLGAARFEADIHYTNLHNVSFLARIIKNENGFFVERIITSDPPR
jgi:preprotein translocase subunit YajC